MFISIILESHCIEALQTTTDYLNWLRLVILIDSGSKKMCHEILHIKEGLPKDGAQLYQNLHSYVSQEDYLFHKEILCPSDKIIDKSKFDLVMYMMLFQTIFGNKYKKLLQDVGTIRNNLFHMKDVSICTKEFEELWNNAYSYFSRIGFDIKSFGYLKICNLFLIEECKGILEILRFC